VWNSKRKGPAFTKIGKHVRYSRTAVDEWLTVHTKEPLAS
jgi:predicted DNA-binding transcriptional regulator AlpA